MHRRNISQRIFVVCSVLSVDYSHQCASVNKLARCIVNPLLPVVSMCLSLHIPSNVHLSMPCSKQCVSVIAVSSALSFHEYLNQQSASVNALYNPVSICQGTMISSVHLSRQYYQYCAPVNALLPAVCIHQCTFAKVCICPWFNQRVHLYMPFLPAVWTYQSNTKRCASVNALLPAVCTYQCTSAPDVHLPMHYFKQIRVKSSICGFSNFVDATSVGSQAKCASQWGGGGGGGSGGVKDQIFLGCHFTKASYLYVLSHIL
jgi:hypothetical protein